MILRRTLLLATAAVLVAAVSLAAERSSNPILVVHDAVARYLSLVRAPGGTGMPQPLPCFDLGRWALRVGFRDGYLVALDTERAAIDLVSLKLLDKIARGEERCDAEHDRVARRVSILPRKTPCRALLNASELYVSYFSDNLVEVYEWTAPSAKQPPDLRRTREIRFESKENLGLSDMAATGETLLVAATGYFCFARDCPSGRLEGSHLYLLPLRQSPIWPFPESRPANLNGAGLYKHPSTGAIYLINAGDFTGGYSSLQRVLPDRTLGPEIRLPHNAAAAAAFPLGPDTFAVLQFSGGHVFLIDAKSDRVVRVLRFDGKSFSPLPSDTRSLPDRSVAELEDLLPDPLAGDRFYLIDRRGERLVHVRWIEREAAFELLGAIPLSTGAYRSAPNWGVWLDSTTELSVPPQSGE